jgi:uncharacterized membrane protein YgaE (UPF0421/DUF939 family)
LHSPSQNHAAINANERFYFNFQNAIEEKVLERAAQKLRLDQLVIQQGRMTQQQKGASKEELLTMIQHGAESIFKDTDSYVQTCSYDCFAQFWKIF